MSFFFCGVDGFSLAFYSQSQDDSLRSSSLLLFPFDAHTTMTPPTHTSSHLLFLPLTLALLAACSTEATSSGDALPCDPPSWTRHPITGQCSAPGDGDDTSDAGLSDLASAPDLTLLRPDMPRVEPDLMSVGDDLGAPDEDMTISSPPDMADMADMGAEEPDLDPPMMQITRFVALGDTGTGSEAQRRVGQAIGEVCSAYGGCQFGMLLGDNAYNSGVDGVDDPFFMDIFVNPYGHLGFPFYVVLGNHDLGGDGLGVSLDFEKGDYQVQYSQINPQWNMPAKFYQVDLQHVWLLALNTTEIFFGQDATQRGTIPDWIDQAPVDDWKIAFGHHPYISNGKHGNAGEYEGLPFVPIANGEHVEDFMEDFICGKVDLYVCGHDHSMQDLEAVCGTEFIVTGAGAKTTEIKGDNPAYFNASQIGFTMFEATPSKLQVYFFDDQKNLLHQRTITR